MQFQPLDVGVFFTPTCMLFHVRKRVPFEDGVNQDNHVGPSDRFQAGDAKLLHVVNYQLINSAP